MGKPTLVRSVPHTTVLQLHKFALQETKVLAEKLTKELACVDGFESFWAVSREKKGYSGVPIAPTSGESGLLQ